MLACGAMTFNPEERMSDDVAKTTARGDMVAEDAKMMAAPAAAPGVSRRRMLEMGAFALAAAGVAGVAEGQAAVPGGTDSHPQNAPGGPPPTEAGPENGVLIKENPSSWSPPHTDAGDVNNFRYPFAFGHNRVSPGSGWARQVTVRDLAISKTLAGVNMRLEPYAVRELHWHVPAEWAYMLSGTCRITGVDAEGHAQVSDLGKGDLWYFPGGVPHSIQALKDGCEFLLVFDDGNFSEFATFLITDWMAHTPPEVVAKNFGLPASTFDATPKKELYIFTAPAPKSLEEDRSAAYGPEGAPPDPFDFRMLAMRPTKVTKGGEVRIVDSTNFKASRTVAAAHVKLRPGALREMHWHPNADEWQYFVAGRGRMTVFIGGGKARTIDFSAGDVGYVDQSIPHYIENTGTEDMEFLEIFKADRYQDISLTQWVSRLPPELVAAHLKVDERVIAAIPKEKAVVMPA
jgi:oxalate decarboxylase